MAGSESERQQANSENTPVETTSDAPPASTAKIDRPVFIVSAPRAGSMLLFELLSRAPNVFTAANRQTIETIPQLHPSRRGFDSNRLTPMDAEVEVVEELKRKLLTGAKDRDNKEIPAGTSSVRMLESSPKDSLRIPFLNAAFPDAKFIYLYREPAQNLGSLIEAWLSGKFVTYPKLPNWLERPWSMVLTPDWRQLRGKSLAEISAAQWILSNQYILDDLSQIPGDRWCVVTHRSLVTKPQEQAERLCKFVGFEWDQNVSAPLPNSKFTLTPPDPRKWQKHKAAIDSVLPRAEPIVARAREIIAPGEPEAETAVPAQTPNVPQAPQVPQAPHVQRRGQAQGQKAATPEQLKSVHTTSFPELLKALNVSLLISTYQAGKVIVLRVVDGKLNTHYRNFHSPMGMACDGKRLAIGTAMNVLEFRNQPNVGKKLTPPLDACYLPHSSHVTGDIRIHEIGWSGPELWIVNTRFSCLCTLDHNNSFVPRWRPPFVTQLAPEDRCHLNGMAMIDGKPKYVTLLGQTDTAGGWRQNKASGGCLMDVESNEVVLTGLSMPHSPRKYNDKLWLLESGYGHISIIDLKAGKTEPVATLPGFTRGVDFVGPYAFIGLSQVRETAIFSGIPITERVQERICGVWVVDLRNGQIVAFLRFQGLVQEIFAIQALPNIAFPDIINDNDQIVSNSFILPDEALKDVPANQKS